MPRIEDSYLTPIMGVSTLAPRNRARGQAGLQVNLRSDPVTKLTRRPSLHWDGCLLTTDKDTAHHSYYRRNEEFKFIVESDGVVHGYVDGVKKTVEGVLSEYGKTPDLFMETINDTTFVVNPYKKVLLSPEIEKDTIWKASHLNVTTALNYSTTLTITVKNETTGSILGVVYITIGNGEKPSDDDPKRATNAVAAEIAKQINAGGIVTTDIPNPDYTGQANVCHQPYNYIQLIAGIYRREDNPLYDQTDTRCKPYLDNPTGIAGLTAVAKGSSVAVWMDNQTAWLELEVDAGRADNVVAINRVVERIDGLPLYAKPGTRITVKPDPTDTEGTYYLEAITLDGETIGNMEEVIWTESRSPEEPFKFVTKTLPHTIRYDYEADKFIVGEAEHGWTERKTGDNESCPVPDFVNRTITALGQFQKRLVLLSDNDVNMTRTDNLFNWWKQSAVMLKVTDPIGVTSNSTGIDILRYIIEHNRDLLFIASNGQFKIEGTQGITPQTTAMPLTTSQEVQVTVPPVSMGTSVYMPINYGDSTGVIRYYGSRDQQDVADAVTNHVIGYMQGTATMLVGSPNLEMLAMRTSASKANEVFIYEQYTQGGKVQQQSWSTWTVPEGNEILAMVFRRDKLVLTVKVGNDIIDKSFNMYSRVATKTHEVFLDDFQTLHTDGNTATLPDHYTTTDLVVVMGDSTIYPLEQIKFTQVGQVLTFSENINAGEVYVGSKFTSAYQPTRPFVEDGKGIAITSDKLRISHFMVNVVDTERMKMHIDSEYYNVPDQELSPRILNRAHNRVGVVDLYTGDYRFSYAQDADLATATFYTDGFLGMTIAGISWAGQYNKSSARLS